MRFLRIRPRAQAALATINCYAGKRSGVSQEVSPGTERSAITSLSIRTNNSLDDVNPKNRTKEGEDYFRVVGKRKFRRNFRIAGNTATTDLRLELPSESFQGLQVLLYFSLGRN